MPKNTHIHVKVTSDRIKELLEEKSECYGSLANFLEHIARHDLIILDSNASKTLKTWMKGEIKIEMKGGKNEKRN